MSLVGFSAKNHPQQVVRDDVDDRRTPPDLLAECAALARVAEFDLDVASTYENKVARWRLVDGLTEPWWGHVWCNPPYSDIRPWVEKAHRELPHGGTFVRHTAARYPASISMLLPANRTEQRWWQELVEPYRLVDAIDVYFLAGRRRFDRPGWTKPAKGDRPPFGLVLIVWEAS